MPAPLGRRNRRSRWAWAARYLTPVGLLVALCGYPLALLVVGRGGTDAVAALVSPPVPVPTTVLRMLLLASLAVLAGPALVRFALGGRAVPSGLLALVRVSGGIGAVVCIAEAVTGQAYRPWSTLLVVLLLSTALLLGTRRRWAIGLVTTLGAVLVGVLALELGATRTGLPRAVDAGYAVFAAILLGASLLRATTSTTTASTTTASPAVTSPAVASPTPHGATAEAGPELELVTVRLTLLALGGGLLTTLAGAVQLALTGPRTWFDVVHTGYGLAAIAQLALPVVATVAWFATLRGDPNTSPGRTGAGDSAAGDSAAGDSAAGDVEAGDIRTGDVEAGTPAAAGLVRVAAGLLVVAFLATSVLATLPTAPAAPEPGRPLLRPVQLGAHHLAVLVLPMRPGPNLVHIGDASADPMAAGPHGGRMAGASMPAGHHHGMPMAAGEGVLTIRAGDTEAPLSPRPGAPGQWAVVDIPAGTHTLTVAADGHSTAFPIDVGSAPADPAATAALTGPDGPECASAALGALVANRRPAPECPAQRLAPGDARVLTRSVEFLASRGVTTLDLVGDASPRSTQAQTVVRAKAAALGLTIAATPDAGHTLLAVSGWSTGATALTELSARSGDGAYGGVLLAPWLLSGPVLAATTSEVLPLAFNPQQDDAHRYSNTLAAAFPGETPSTAGYLAWRGADPAEPLAFYGAAQVNVPMGGAMDDMGHGGGPGSWYPSGTIVPISGSSTPEHPLPAP